MAPLAQKAQVEITPAPVTLGRVSAWYKWLCRWLRMDAVLDRVHEVANKPAGVPQSPAEAFAYKAQQQEAAQTVSVNMGEVWRAMADEECALELANILFVRSDGEPLTWQDVWERIPEEEFQQTFFIGASRCAQLMNGLVGCALSYG